MLAWLVDSRLTNDEGLVEGVMAIALVGNWPGVGDEVGRCQAARQTLEVMKVEG